MDMMTIRKMVMGQMSAGVWKQKKITVDQNLSQSNNVRDWFLAQIPSGVNWAWIINDNLDPTTYVDKQCLCIGFIDNCIPYYWTRYNAPTESWTTGSTYGIGTGLAIAQGDTYTIFYQ